MNKISIILITIKLYALHLAVASNLSYTIKDIIKNFNKKYPNIKISTTISSSGSLYSQIIHNAPYDIFLSADTKYPTLLYKKHLSSKPKIYAKGLIVLVPKQNIKNCKKIAIANYKIAPYGTAAKEVIDKLNIKAKLIQANSISQVLNYIKIVPCAIIAKSSAIKLNLNYTNINPKLYTPISQAGVIIKDSKESQLFFNFLLNSKDIFKKYGYN